ncbi:MAG TPA: tetratricopeptide repeat protein, partial [Thiolapillus brandeum]|nr:tetratricopeptide repeat protein [Thiolapillus brandeum]
MGIIMYSCCRPLLTLLLTVVLITPASQGIAQSSAATSLLERAQFWRSLERMDLAAQAVQKMLRTTPEDPQALKLLAFIKLDLKQREDAEQLLAQLQRQHPLSPHTAALAQTLG